MNEWMNEFAVQKKADWNQIYHNSDSFSWKWPQEKPKEDETIKSIASC